MDHEARRGKCDEFLKRASDHKLLTRGSEAARSALEQAYSLAIRPSPLPSPWPEVAAYRLAHLEMRAALAGDSAAVRRHLERADELFAEASRARSLGPWPNLYRLATVCRLGGDVRAHWRRLVALVREQRAPAHDPRIQGDAFNILELAGYLTESDLQPLDGLQLDGGSEVPDQSWCVVGPTPAMSKVLMYEEQAREELDARLEAHPEAFGLIVDESGAAFFAAPKRTASRKREFRPQDRNAKWPTLVCRLLMEGSLSHERACEPFGTDTNFRQARRRLRTLLGQDLMENGEFGGFVRSEEVLVFGAVWRGACPK